MLPRMLLPDLCSKIDVFQSSLFHRHRHALHLHQYVYAPTAIIPVCPDSHPIGPCPDR